MDINRETQSKESFIWPTFVIGKCVERIENNKKVTIFKGRESSNDGITRLDHWISSMSMMMSIMNSPLCPLWKQWMKILLHTSNVLQSNNKFHANNQHLSECCNYAAPVVVINSDPVYYANVYYGGKTSNSKIPF